MLRLHPSSYVVSVGLHLIGLAIIIAAPFVKTGYEPDDAAATTTQKHVILYYAPNRVKPLPTPPPVVGVKRAPSIIFHPRPQNVPTAPKRDTFTPPAPPVIAAVIPDRASDIPQSSAPALRPPEKPEAVKPAPVKTVKVGSFGDPNGIAPAARPSAPSLMATAGVFDASSNSNSKRGSVGGGAGSLKTGSFSDGAGTAGTAVGSSGSVQTGGFSDGGGSVAAPKRRPAPQEIASTPLQILSHPKPTYSEEARQRKVEGIVDLEVLFRADGGIEVLRVVRGLGYGLDEAARQVATQIRFKPSTRDGIPVDSKTIVHVTF
ncbi:MAG: TonB family protein, partial [Bryobacteraceae bacterium]